MPSLEEVMHRCERRRRLPGSGGRRKQGQHEPAANQHGQRFFAAFFFFVPFPFFPLPNSSLTFCFDITVPFRPTVWRAAHEAAFAAKFCRGMRAEVIAQASRAYALSHS
jgi:hypothetical protein